MVLHWIKTFEKVDQDLIQECFTDKEHGLLHRGQLVRLCSDCKQWVSEHDYKDFCQKGFHEYSIPVEVETLVQVESKA